MRSALVQCLAALSALVSHASAAASTLTITATLAPPASGGAASAATLTITISPTPNPAIPAISSPPPGVSPGPFVPDFIALCASLDTLVGRCTTLASFYGLPRSAQAQCLCNVGPWDAVAAACYAQLTVRGQVYASLLTSQGFLDLCSTNGAGPAWPTSVLASISAAGASAAVAETGTETPAIATASATAITTVSATASAASGSESLSGTASSSPNAAPTLARPLCEAWFSSLMWLLLPWLAEL